MITLPTVAGAGRRGSVGWRRETRGRGGRGCRGGGGTAGGRTCARGLSAPAPGRFRTTFVLPGVESFAHGRVRQRGRRHGRGLVAERGHHGERRGVSRVHAAQPGVSWGLLQHEAVNCGLRAVIGWAGAGRDQ